MEVRLMMEMSGWGKKGGRGRVGLRLRGAIARGRVGVVGVCE